ncbi:MAG TPA: inositol monophosphatase family protein [Acidimicrobiales bacterium]|nr:inositol monophosphatase family protein [Acidimicrobiales bacterium]
MDDLTELAAVAEGAARRAAIVLIEGLRTDRTVVATKSSVTDMVTAVDRAAEVVLVDYLLGARPDDAIIGEEGTTTAGTTGITWVLDPIDGTTNYLYGFPAFCVSIGAERGGVRIAGAVHDPVRDETFTAWLGGGAFLNGAPIRCSDRSDLATALVGTGFAYAAEGRAWQADVLRHLLPRVRDIRRAGSAALDLCWVACGRLDATVERGLQPWDLAAGALVVTEAGGVVHLDDHTSWRLVVSSAPAIAGDLLALVTEAETQAGPRPF